MVQVLITYGKQVRFLIYGERENIENQPRVTYVRCLRNVGVTNDSIFNGQKILFINRILLMMHL